MKIEAYKTKSGILVETERECIIENVKDDIYKFLMDNREYCSYDMFTGYRIIIIKELAEKIVDNRKKFIDLFRELDRN